MCRKLRVMICLATIALVWALCLAAPFVIVAEDSLPLDGREGRNLALNRFRPRPMLRVEQHYLMRAKFPVVDVHTHPRYRLRNSREKLNELVRTMDRHNIAVCVSLDGRLGEELDEHMKYLWTRYRDRFVIFTNID